MKILSPSLVAQLEAGTAIVKILAKLVFRENTLYMNDADIDIYHGGHRYLASGGLVFDRFEGGGQMGADAVSIMVAGHDGLVRSLLMNAECRGSISTFYWSALNTYGRLIEAGEFFRGEMDDFTPISEPIRMTFTSEMINWTEKHMVKSEPTCNLQFKGGRCRYAGPNSYCDHTYSLCSAYGNTDNNSGSRWLPVVSEQELPWGRTT